MPTSELAWMSDLFRPRQPLRNLILLVYLGLEVAEVPSLLEQEMASRQDQEEKAKGPRKTMCR
jgi:hypothetical protein